MAEGELLDQLQTTVSAKGHHLAFKVVFQRALFDALMWLAKVNDEILPEDESDVDDVTDDLLEEPAESPAPVLDLGEHNTRRAKQLVEALNFCEEALPELFSHDFVVELDDSESFRFWLGTLLTADNNIDFTQSASIRARDVLVWIGILWILRQRDDESLSEDMESFLEALEDGSDAQKKLYQALRRFANVDRGAARRILEAADEEVTAEAAWEVTKQRFAVLWQLIVADPHV